MQALCVADRYRSILHSALSPAKRTGKRGGGEGTHLMYNRSPMTIRGGEGGGTRFMRNRSLKTIDPGISTLMSWSTSDLHRPGRHRVHQPRIGESHEGRAAFC